MAAEVAPKYAINMKLKHKRVIHSLQANLWKLVEARLPPPRETGVHNVIGNKEKGLQLLLTPPKDIREQNITLSRSVTESAEASGNC